MRTAEEIYEEYRTPPWLQLHQLRVAAIASIVADAGTVAVDKDIVVRTALLHDIGSIVKFDFEGTGGGIPSLCDESEIPHWKEVQREFRERYGDKEHPATDAILAEIGGLDRIRAIMDETGFSNMQKIITDRNYEALVVQYADMRIGPYGVLSLAARIADVERRYEHVLRASGRYEMMGAYRTTADEIEKMLFTGTTLKPENITDAYIAPYMEELKKYAIS
jgi:hypothetical protein